MSRPEVIASLAVSADGLPAMGHPPHGGRLGAPVASREATTVPLGVVRLRWRVLRP